MEYLFQSNLNAVLCNLEELSIRSLPALVEICKGTPPPRLLQKLKKLNVRECEGLVSVIPRKLIQNFQNLEYLIIVDCENLVHVVEMEEEESVVSLNSNISTRITLSDPVMFAIFPCLKKFEIEICPQTRYVFSMSVARNLLQLKKLKTDRCPEMEVLLKYGDEDEEDDTAILPRLKKLIVQDAPKLRSFTNRNLVMELPSLLNLHLCKCFILERLPFGIRSMPNLKSVYISEIVKIKYVFNMRIAQNLLQLERLDVNACEEMVVLFEYEDAEEIQLKEETAILPRLKVLIVKNAPKLRSFTNQNLVMELPSLEKLEMINCLSLERLPFGSTSVPNLKELHIESIPVRYVFTMRVVRNLLLLEELNIHRCWEMEVLFKYEDGEDDIQFNQDTAILPRLKVLTVQFSPKLKSFTNRNLVMELPSLEKLDVIGCNNLERLPFGTTSVPNLESVEMNDYGLFHQLKWEDESLKERLQAILTKDDSDDDSY